MNKIFGAGVLMFLQVNFFPNVNLLVVLFVVMVLDFVTGVLKAKVQGVPRTSDRYRDTVRKFTQYGFGLLTSYSLAYVANTTGGEAVKHLTPYLVDGLAVFIIYVEVTSIFENLYQMDSRSMISKYFFAPMLKILTWQIRNNPVVSESEKVK